MLQSLHTGRVRAWLAGARTLIALALLVLFLPSCAARGAASQGDMLEAYRAGRFPESLAKAEDIAGQTYGLERDRAALIAGQSAHAMGKRSVAEKWLKPLTFHRDPEINGNANATLGLLAMNDHNYGSAAVMFAAASSRLTGDDGARSALYAGDCYEQLGQTTKARAAYQQAAQMAQDATLKQSATQRLGSGRYIIQLGALASRDAADKLARQFAPNATRARLSAPQVVPNARGGGPVLWSVQVGPFPSRPAAEAAKANAGLPGAVMSMDR